ncbi:MAG: transposase, partial [Pirellulaceae bacterium]|nr:transposase [Pirellulaceae bacterium]
PPRVPPRGPPRLRPSGARELNRLRRDLFRRLEEYDGQQVSYWYEDHKTQAIQHTTLPVLRFIGRMVQHILPKSFQRIRYFGLHSHTRYQAIRGQLATLLPDSPASDPRGYRVLPRPQFAQVFLSTFRPPDFGQRSCGLI